MLRAAPNRTSRLTPSIGLYLGLMSVIVLAGCGTIPQWARPPDAAGNYISERPGEFRRTLRECVATHDPEFLLEFDAHRDSDDYPLSGWFVDHEKVNNITVCMHDKGWELLYIRYNIFKLL